MSLLVILFLKIKINSNQAWNYSDKGCSLYITDKKQEDILIFLKLVI